MFFVLLAWSLAARPAEANPKVMRLLDKAKQSVKEGNYRLATDILKQALNLMHDEACDRCFVGRFKGIQSYKLGRGGRYFKMNFSFTNRTQAATKRCTLHATVFNKDGKKVLTHDVKLKPVSSGQTVEVISSVVRQRPADVGRIEFAFSALCPRESLPPALVKL